MKLITENVRLIDSSKRISMENQEQIDFDSFLSFSFFVYSPGLVDGPVNSSSTCITSFCVPSSFKLITNKSPLRKFVRLLAHVGAKPSREKKNLVYLFVYLFSQ